MPAQDNATAGVITTQAKNMELAAETAAKPGVATAQDAPVKAVSQEGNKDASKDTNNDANRDFRVTMEQSIEAARKRKMRELAAAERQQLGLKEEVAAPMTLTQPLPPMPVSAPTTLATPRLWSLSAAGSRVWAELWLEGRVIQLDSMNGQIIQLDADQPAPDLGAWTALTLTENGLLLERKAKAVSKKSKQPVMRERLLLRAPARGISAASFKFNLPTTDNTVSASAQRASELPLEQSGEAR